MKIAKKKIIKFFMFNLALIFHTANSVGIVDFKSTDLDSPPVDLVWCGISRDTVIVLTESNSLYRSDNKGFSFKKLNDVLMHTGKDQLEESDSEIGKVTRILESPVDKSLLIFLGTHGINWIGEDCGRKVRALNHGRKVQEYIFHPTERNWGLASAFTLCEDFKNGEPCKHYKEIFLTKDLGDSWDILGSYIVQFGWGIINEDHIKAGIPKERILVTLEPKAKGDQKSSGWSYKVDFIYSDDFFRTKRIGAHKGNKFLLTKHFLYVAQLVDQDLQEVILLSDSSFNKVYELQPLKTSSKKFREHSYTFLDISDNSVFLNINHFGSTSKFGHLYASDINGSKFSLSLKYNVKSSSDHKCDFQKIESIEGSFIANVICETFMSQSIEEIEEKEFEDENSMQDVHNRNNQINESYKDFIKTMITFNKGGKWRRIQAPPRDINGKKYECEPDESCYINLHGMTGDYPTFYSVESAAGIVIANGNIGQYLSHNSDEISTFLSRDGGANWFEVKKGSHIYEIGDHGALIVMADDQNPTDTVYYSWDEGLAWQDLKLKEKIMVKNIIIEPTSTSQNFVLYGEIMKKGEKKGVTIGIDFSSLHEPQCRNADSPGTEGSDYETWTPNDGRAGHECLMGKKIIFTRRKREAECYNGQAFERRIETQHCECTEEDYECDVGFGRNSPFDPCTSIDSSIKSHNNPDSYIAPTECQGTYTISKGYRRVPGNVCINGVKFDPIIIHCPNKFFATLGKFAVILLVGLIIIVVAFTFMKKDLIGDVTQFVKSKTDQKENFRKKEYFDLDPEGGSLFSDDNYDESVKVDIKGEKATKKKQKKQKDENEKLDSPIKNLI